MVPSLPVAHEGVTATSAVSATRPRTRPLVLARFIGREPSARRRPSHGSGVLFGGFECKTGAARRSSCLEKPAVTVLASLTVGAALLVSTATARRTRTTPRFRPCPRRSAAPRPRHAAAEPASAAAAEPRSRRPAALGELHGRSVREQLRVRDALLREVRLRQAEGQSLGHGVRFAVTHVTQGR